MAILTRDREDERIVIDLAGPSGNAFVLLGTANNLARQMSYSSEQIEELNAEMKASDYENLIQVFDKHFGHIADLIRPPQDVDSEDERG